MFTRTYLEFNYPSQQSGDKTLLTGIRPVTCHQNKFYISGFHESSITTSFIYKGKITGKGKWYDLNYPPSKGVTPIATYLYGPNNGGSKTIQVVGNYKIQESDKSLGCLYEGDLKNNGKWTTLIPTFNGKEAQNTIAHSTMGGLVVGNYDFPNDVKGNAFIYDIKTKEYFNICKKGARSITVYGIWHNCKNSYTLCGSYSKDGLITVAYLVDWDHKHNKLHNWRKYYYNNDKQTKLTHFDGITGDGDGGYNLTGDWAVDPNSPSLKHAFFAHVGRKHNGHFRKRGYWEGLLYPGSDITSGNSAAELLTIGVFKYKDDQTVNGYITYPC